MNYLFPVINLISDYLNPEGEWRHQAFQVPGANSPYMAARAVFDLLTSMHCTPESIGLVEGDYTLPELARLADSEPEEGTGPVIRCLYFDPKLAAKITKSHT